MKSRIPWDNYIMRKYGLSIRAQICDLALRQGIAIKKYKNEGRAMEVAKQAV